MLYFFYTLLPSISACPALCILAEGRNVRIHEDSVCKLAGVFYVPSEPEAEDSDAARVFRILATAAELPVRGCVWTLVVPDWTAVNAAAVMRRLACGFSSEEPLVLARMAGRLALNFIYDRGEGVRFGTLRGGVLLNEAAMRLVGADPDLYDFSVFARLGAESGTLLRGKKESHAVDDVGFNRPDFVFTMYWWRRFSVRVQNWASYMEQYVLGADVARRLDVRARVLGMPCVLVAHPVDVAASSIDRHLATCSPDPRCKVLDGGDMTYSWLKWDQSGWDTEAFIPDKIRLVLDQCGAPSGPRDLECMSGEVVEYEFDVEHKTTEYIDGVKSVIVLSPPGGGTSWMFHKLKENVKQAEKAVVDFDLFQPYCNDKLRIELSQIFGAGEDNSKYKLVAETVPEKSLLPVLFDLVSKGKTVVTKEVMNLFRILDLLELDNEHHILFLFRSRHHTFPSSEAVCRTCFFAAFQESFVAQNFTIPWLQEAKNLLTPMHPDAMLTHVLIHTTLWRYVLYKLRLRGGQPRFLKYADMMRASDPTVAITSAWNFDGRLSAIIDFEGLGRSVNETRQSSVWLDARERKYLDLDLEHMVKGYLAILQQIDPETDVSLLLYAN